MTRSRAKSRPQFRRLVAAFTLVFAVALSSPGHAQSEEEAGAFRSVISAQVAAFRADAWERAFSFASPGIRRMFGSASRFRRMVLSGYEAVARPRVFEFEDATLVNGRPAQPVYVIGPDGVAKRALYFMQRQSDGSWKIDGVVLMAVEDRTS